MEEEPRFTYEDLLDCVAVLRNAAYGKPLAELIALVGYYVVDRDVMRMLRYLVGRGKLTRAGGQGPVRYEVACSTLTSQITELKVKRSAEPWDGAWHVFTYDMPISHNAARRQLAQRLHMMGFASMGRSAWISPYDWQDVLSSLIEGPRCDGSFYCLASASIVALGRAGERSLVELWDVREVAERYERIAGRCARCASGRTPEAQRSRAKALFSARKELALTEKLDPMLPAELRPHDWPRGRAVARLETLRAKVQEDMKRSTKFEALI